MACRSQPHSASVSEYSSSLRDGVLKPFRGDPVDHRGDRVRAAGERQVRAVEHALGDGVLGAADVGVVELFDLGLVLGVVAA